MTKQIRWIWKNLGFVKPQAPLETSQKNPTRLDINHIISVADLLAWAFFLTWYLFRLAHWNDISLSMHFE